MLDWLAQPISAGIAAYGAYRGQKSANIAQMELAQKQMDFQERMSSTSYQRAVADMRQAGINPMLAYMQGGATSPGGAMAKVEDVIGPAVNSAMSALRLGREINLMDAQHDKVRSDIGVNSAEIYKKMAEAGILRAGGPAGVPFTHQAQRYRAELLRWQRDMLRAGFPAAKVKGTSIGGLLQLIFGSSGPVSSVSIGR